ncbi:MAG: DNA-binding protein HU, partial [Dehalococcoidia bacterium]|nr:DNA-binding protein HU [Dehalococcoidia bacterium]
MNKTEMVAALARKTEITQSKAAEVVDAIFST